MQTMASCSRRLSSTRTPWTCYLPPVRLQTFSPSERGRSGCSAACRNASASTGYHGNSNPIRWQGERTGERAGRQDGGRGRGGSDGSLGQVGLRRREADEAVGREVCIGRVSGLGSKFRGDRGGRRRSVGRTRENPATCMKRLRAGVCVVCVPPHHGSFPRNQSTFVWAPPRRQLISQSEAPINPTGFPCTPLEVQLPLERLCDFCNSPDTSGFAKLVNQLGYRVSRLIWVTYCESLNSTDSSAPKDSNNSSRPWWANEGSYQSFLEIK